jgi:hypothetical protein
MDEEKADTFGTVFVFRRFLCGMDILSAVYDRGRFYLSKCDRCDTGMDLTWAG